MLLGCEMYGIQEQRIQKAGMEQDSRTTARGR